MKSLQSVGAIQLYSSRMICLQGQNNSISTGERQSAEDNKQEKKKKVYVSSARGLQLRMRGKDMKGRDKKSQDELRPEYNFDYSKAVRGKYYKRLMEEGSNVIVLEPDVAKAFRDSASVNEALRSLLDLTRSTQRLTRGRSSGRP